MRNLNLLCLLACATLLVLACGKAQPDAGENKSTAVPVKDSGKNTGTVASNNMVAYSASVTPATSTAAKLALLGGSGRFAAGVANAQAYSITLTGCTATPGAVVTQTSGYLEVYQFDHNCLAKLTTFTLNSIVYTPKAGSLFHTWQIGDTATFSGTGSELLVTVLDTISNTSVATGGTIHYQFSQITKAATDSLGEAVTGASTNLSVDGQASPDFQIVKTTLVGLTTDGNAQFQFVLECDDGTNGITGTDAASYACYSVRLNAIYMVLAEDTFGVPGPSSTDLQTIYTAAGGGVQLNDADMFTAGQGTPVLANGGFTTAGVADAKVMVMSGVKPIHTHPNMLLILKAGPSYTYYPVQVTVVTQSGT